MVHPPKKLKERGDPGETEAVNLERYGETEAVNGLLSFDMERPKLIKINMNHDEFQERNVNWVVSGTGS